MVAELQLGDKGVMLLVVELLDGRMDRELPTPTTVVEPPMVQEIVHRLGHRELRLQRTACRTALPLAPRHLGMVEEMLGAPRPRRISRSSINQTTAGRINPLQTAGAATLTMPRRLAPACLLPLPLR